jgi:hypothetical protein
MLVKSQRVYNNFNTGERFEMFVDSDTHQHVLVNSINGEKITAFVLCAFSPIEYKTAKGKIIGLSIGEFLPNPKNEITHKRFLGFNRFVKL